VISYWEPVPYPVSVQAGDPVFIAGRLPRNTGSKLGFEHVALAAQPSEASESSDILDIPVYALPESVDSRSGPPFAKLHLATARFWIQTNGVGTEIGSPTTVWNAAGREPAIADPKTSQHFGLMLALLEGTETFGYEAVFRVDPTLKAGINTNCLGFVCSVFEYFNIQHLRHDLPDYESPYSYAPGSRNFPSPGHLARALNLSPSTYPYSPSDSQEAQEYSRVDKTLEEVFEF
jgi:hypothetical protein